MPQNAFVFLTICSNTAVCPMITYKIIKAFRLRNVVISATHLSFQLSLSLPLRKCIVHTFRAAYAVYVKITYLYRVV